MNAKSDGWESYTDDTGRRHWRWPATNRQMEVSPRAESGPRQRISFPESQQQHHSPLRLKGK